MCVASIPESLAHFGVSGASFGHDKPPGLGAWPLFASTALGPGGGGTGVKREHPSIRRGNCLISSTWITGGPIPLLGLHRLGEGKRRADGTAARSPPTSFLSPLPPPLPGSLPNLSGQDRSWVGEGPGHSPAPLPPFSQQSPRAKARRKWATQRPALQPGRPESS